jgi:hypothetical protein
VAPSRRNLAQSRQTTRFWEGSGRASGHDGGTKKEASQVLPYEALFQRLNKSPFQSDLLARRKLRKPGCERGLLEEMSTLISLAGFHVFSAFQK